MGFTSAGRPFLSQSSSWINPYLSEDGRALACFASLAANRPSDNAKDRAASIVPADSTLVWLAAYTTPRHEKAVARHLEVRNVEHFLPVYKSLRSWRNGCKVLVEFPLFPGYLFVRVEHSSTQCLREVPGLIAFVGPSRAATPISDAEINWLQQDLPKRKFAPHPYLMIGSKVRIVSGPLAGASGILLRHKNACLRVVLSMELIRQSVAVEVGASEIEPY